MRASAARLMNSPVRLADLEFPRAKGLIHRTRLAFIHLDNLLAWGKRDRDGRVDGYIAAYLPDECLLLFFRHGEAVNAASLHTAGRQVITITEALRRMRLEAERGELAYWAAPMEQLAWMYHSCAAPAQPHSVDAADPATLFPTLQQEQVSGVLELIAGGRVSYLRLEQGRDHHPSAQVIDALARALQLDEDAAAHLHALARPAPARRRPDQPERAPGRSSS